MAFDSQGNCRIGLLYGPIDNTMGVYRCLHNEYGFSWELLESFTDDTATGLTYTTDGDQIMGWFCSEGVATATAPASPTLRLAELKAYPNPFNPQTTISFNLAQDQWVKLEIFDLHGRKVRSLLDGPLTAGEQEVSFDGRDDQEVPLASGIYFAQLRPSLGEPGVVKLTLLK